MSGLPHAGIHRELPSDKRTNVIEQRAEPGTDPVRDGQEYHGRGTSRRHHGRIATTQTELKERIRDAIDDIRCALGERESLWAELEDKLNEREAERTEAYFNLGYEYGIATGRAEAFGKLSENSDLETQKLAERLRSQVQGTGLPPSSIIAALLEIAWIFAHDIQTSNHTNDDA